MEIRDRFGDAATALMSRNAILQPIGEKYYFLPFKYNDTISLTPFILYHAKNASIGHVVPGLLDKRWIPHSTYIQVNKEDSSS